MSRPRVIEGTDDRGRPRARWADPDTADQPYGFMEPAHVATVERRKATPEELEAARAREAQPSLLPRSPGVIVSRHHQPAPPAEPLEEEPVVPNPAAEPSPNIPDFIPAEPTAQGVDGDDVALDRLSVAAEAARDAWDAKAAADTAWEVARNALEAAYAGVAWLVEPRVAHGNAVIRSTIRLDDVGEPAPAPKLARSRVGEGQRTGQASARDRRATMVLASMARHDDDIDAVAAELKMRRNAVTQVVKFAHRRAAAQQQASA